MDKFNILNYQGFLTAEDRKKPLSHSCRNFHFQSCIDLSSGVKIIPYGSRDTIPLNAFSQDLASFIAWWTMNVLKDLNGFSGIDCINYTMEDCEIVNV
jgi:hypothetical protein